jgi:hypothetical protein
MFLAWRVDPDVGHSRVPIEGKRLDEIVALTADGSIRSRGVMDRIGITRSSVVEFDEQISSTGRIRVRNPPRLCIAE